MASLLSEEDSIVILANSTPSPSMENFIFLDKPASLDESLMVNSKMGKISGFSSMMSNADGSMMNNSIQVKNDETAKNKTQSYDKINNKENISSNSNSMVEKANASLVSDIASRFPSILSVSSRISSTDLASLQTLVTEHAQLRENLQKTNLAMRRNFQSIQNWQEQIKSVQTTQTSQLKEQQETINLLKTENELLRNDLAVQTEQFIKQREELMNKLESKEREFKEKTKLYEIQLETIRAENTEIVQRESEKSSLVINLSAEIEKLQIEKQEFVVIQPNNLSDGLLNFISKQEHEDMITEINIKLNTAQSELEENLKLYGIERQQATEEIMEIKKQVSEKDSIIKNLSSEIAKLTEEKINLMSKSSNEITNKHNLKEKTLAETKDLLDKNSQLTAQILDYENKQKAHIDELDCLKANYTASEDLNKKLRNDLCEMRTKLHETEEKLGSYAKEMKTLADNVDVLSAQVEIYKNDFEAERTARQNIAGERERILTDLRMLQQRNTQLIEESQQRRGNSPANFAAMREPVEEGATAQGPVAQSQESGTTNENVSNDNGYERLILMCPLCSKTFGNLTTLQNHCSDCTGMP